MTTITNERYNLVKVHENKHLIEQCVALLNAEWPRDVNQRIKTLNRSSDNFSPICLALIDHHHHHHHQQKEDTVVGFVKLTNELPFSKNVYLESLVVEKSRRGQGLGRFIMEEVYKLVKSTGLERIILSTIDKEPFYTKMGFCRVQDNRQSQQSDKLTRNNHSVLAVPPLSPPPPPPPPPLLSLAAGSATDVKVFLYKPI